MPFFFCFSFNSLLSRRDLTLTPELKDNTYEWGTWIFSYPWVYICFVIAEIFCSKSRKLFFRETHAGIDVKIKRRTKWSYWTSQYLCTEYRLNIQKKRAPFTAVWLQLLKYSIWIIKALAFLTSFIQTFCNSQLFHKEGLLWCLSM